MGKIYVGQTALTIDIETCADLSSASSVKIKFVRPDLSTGELTNIISITNLKKGEISWQPVDATVLNQKGVWKFWVFVVFDSGRQLSGEPYFVEIYNEGE